MDYIYVGKIVNTHGIKGEVRIVSDSDFKDERFSKGSKLFIKDNKEMKELTVNSHRVHKKFDLVTFLGYNNINDIIDYKGKQLYINKEDLTDLDEDEFYYHDLVGCEVYTEDEYVGKISGIMETGANDVWRIKRENDKDLLIPYIDSVVKSVDIENKKVEITIIDGLL